MKTNTDNQSGLLSRPEQLSTSTLPRISFVRRRANRSLNTGTLLRLLRSNTPRLFELAEVVGQWVWIRFAERQPQAVTRQLAQLGFHWNKTRQTWQHPCGVRCCEFSPFDPRRKYGSYFAADVMLP